MPDHGKIFVELDGKMSVMNFNLPHSIYEELRRDDGYRPNIGMILMNCFGKVLWARRASRDGWQFPQGGIERNESFEDALLRELYEEVGLGVHQVNMLAHTLRWMHYDLPGSYLKRARRRGDSKFRGQKQIWCLLVLLGDDSQVCLSASKKPEFDKWIWTDWWTAVQQIVDFKRPVYESVWSELNPFLSTYMNFWFPETRPGRPKA
ncbi:MAG: RNA pyrophosphohydrolase [Gammaproteobacteria bacterium]|nr:RNA pyrophosphohydrolase [Gammaproteobacteria bacterium]